MEHYRSEFINESISHLAAIVFELLNFLARALLPLPLALVEAFFGRFVLVHNSDVANAVNLMESLDTMFDELSKFDSRVDSVRDTLDDDLLLSLSLEEVVSSFQVAADSDLVLNTDFVSGE